MVAWGKSQKSRPREIRAGRELRAGRPSCLRISRRYGSGVSEGMRCGVWGGWKNDFVLGAWLGQPDSRLLGAQAGMPVLLEGNAVQLARGEWMVRMCDGDGRLLEGGFA